MSHIVCGPLYEERLAEITELKNQTDQGAIRKTRDDATTSDRPDTTDMTDSSIRLKPITGLLTDNQGSPSRFWIPSYQRGYRWKPLQVTQLLDDIWDFIQFSESEDGSRHLFYCLQPLVIMPHEDGRLEVVDGQQRLTTIYVLLTYLQDILTLLGKKRFGITFETRGEANEPFLADIDLDRAEENIDFFHICEARKAIDEWFSGRDPSHKINLLQHLLNDDEVGRNVKVIWYELGPEDNPVAAFTRLNVGKIPLTNDELIRALFLRRGRFDSTEANALQLRIAHEWDQLEKALQSDAFWYFLRNDEPPEHNRIGVLFELTAIQDGLITSKGQDIYSIFYAYNEKLKAKDADLEQEWLKVKQTFMMLDEWFEDRRLYHVTGFLIHQGMDITELRSLSSACTKSEFEDRLRQSIFDRVVSDDSITDCDEGEIRDLLAERLAELEYGYDHAAIRSLLLLFNIATLLDNDRSNMRFQFDSFKTESWDIEHIRSVTDDRPERHYARVDWFNHVLGYLEANDVEPGLQNEISEFVGLSEREASNETFEDLYNRVLQRFTEDDAGEPDHTIANLTLLDQGTNRSYKNAVFAVKRERLLSLDQAGIFVPLCTRNAFLKCYSPQVDNVMFWGESDRNGYLEAIRETLVRFFLGKRGV